MDLFKPNVERMKAKRDIEGLIKATLHDDPFICRSALTALGSLEAEEAVIPIIRRVDAPSVVQIHSPLLFTNHSSQSYGFSLTGQS